MSDFVLALVSAALINHLALEPLRPDRQRLHALGACSALLLLVALPAGCWLQRVLLTPLGLQALHLFLLLPLLTALAWYLPHLVKLLRPDWPTTGLHRVLLGNGAALGLMLTLASDSNTLWQALCWGLLAGPAFWLALLLFADLRERSQPVDMPQALQGLPMTLIAAGIMTLAFSGLVGVVGP